ncbi:MAG: DUF481 domain-containing protein, partial [Thermoanaerobaculia bacterium]
MVFCGITFGEGQNPEKFSMGLGFSYLGTTRNTENRNFGLDFNFKKPFCLWAIEGGLYYIRVEEKDVLNSERYRANLKGIRSLTSKLDYFLMLDWERDKFSGFENRSSISTGIGYKILSSEKDFLSGEAGISYIKEEYVSSEKEDYLAGLFGIKYIHNWTEKSKFQQKIVYIPNFEEGSKWRGESETSAQASLTDRMALKFSFLLRYQNEPLEGFKKTDTITALSLVLNF